MHAHDALQDAGCVEVSEDGAIDALTLGRTASFYYLKYESMRVLSQGLHAGMAVPEVCPLCPRGLAGMDTT